MENNLKDRILNDWKSEYNENLSRLYPFLKDNITHFEKFIKIYIWIDGFHSEELSNFNSLIQKFITHLEFESDTINNLPSYMDSIIEELRKFGFPENVLLLYISSSIVESKSDNPYDKLIIFTLEGSYNNLNDIRLLINSNIDYKIIETSMKEIKEFNADLPLKAISEIIDFRRNHFRKKGIESLKKDIISSISLGIITALVEELRAVKAVFEDVEKIQVPKKNGNTIYWVGKISSLQGGTHNIVLSLADKGNTLAAICTTIMIYDFFNIKSIMMVGIAGGVPCVENVEDHVRLGDIVVSDKNGVLQYDFGKKEGSEIIPRFTTHRPSYELLNVVRYLIAENSYPWEDYIEVICNKLGKSRPCRATDILFQFKPSIELVKHPNDPERRENQPRLFLGSIASGNKVIRDSDFRDKLRNDYKIKAIEMEGSGIMDATWHFNVGYLIIRGICDYCDSIKNNLWHDYAAIVAAALTKAIIEQIPL